MVKRKPPTRILAGSFTRLQTYEECPFRAGLAYVAKVPEPPREKGNAADRGNAIHSLAEDFVLKGAKLDAQLLNFEKELRHAKKLHEHEPGSVFMEEMWYFNDAWQRLPEDTPYWSSDIWMRIKADLGVWMTPAHLVVVDIKTGRRVNNEVKHAKQVQLYQLGAFLRFPQLERVDTEIWYTDQDELYSMTYTRKQGLKFLKHWNDKMLEMTTDEIFDAKPGQWSCRFCPYKTGRVGKKGPEGTGHCDRNPV